MKIEQQWEEIQKVGKSKYIWKNYRLICGIIGVLLFRIIDILMHGIGNKSYGRLILECFVMIIVVSAIIIFSRYLSWSEVESTINIKKMEEEKLSVTIDFCYFCGNELNEGDEVCPNCMKEIEK